jgi:hypothetical protein
MKIILLFFFIILSKTIKEIYKTKTNGRTWYMINPTNDSYFNPREQLKIYDNNSWQNTQSQTRMVFYF